MTILYTILILLVLLFLIEFIFLCARLGPAGLKELLVKKECLNLDIKVKESGLKILVVGDSTATARGVKIEESITGRLSSKCNAQIHNLGENGAKIHDVTEQLDSAGKETYDLVLIQAGNNDIVWFTPLYKIQAQVPILFEKAKNLAPRVIMLRGGNLGNFPFWPRSVSWIISRRSLQVREICKKIAENNGVLYVELFQSRKDDVFLKNIPHYYTPDLIHLNGNGYKVWFDYLMGEMEKADYDF